MKNIVLVGHGYWGKNLERVIKKNKKIFNLVAIVDLLYKETKAAAAAGPERGFMPQTAELSPEVDKMKAIMKGAVNWNPKA